ncbi:MAG: ion transporter [Pseudomonadota bacterium]
MPAGNGRSIRKARIRLILEGKDPIIGRRVAIAIQVLILISVISVAIETLPGLPEGLRRFLLIEEMVIVSIFAIEYGLRIYSARAPLRYIVSPFGIIDLLSILPALFLLGYDLRSLRVLRALRILRLLKMVRYVKAFGRLWRAFKDVGDELVVFAASAAIMLYFCATAVYLFEHDAQPEAFASIPHALWWAVVTFTTVGYGDVYPVTAGGRIFTGVMLILALGVVAVPTGLIATALTDIRKRDSE